MKFLIAGFVFFLTLGLTIQSTANETETCKAGATPKCSEPTAKEKLAEHDDTAKMNSLFPEKKKNQMLATKPTMVELSSPKFLAEVSGGNVKLQWTDVKGANTYHLQVATDPNFKWLVTNENFVKTNSYDFNKLEAGIRYYWRVAARNTDNDSTFTKSNFVSSAFLAK